MNLNPTTGASGFFTSTKGIDVKVISFEVFEVPRFLPTGEGEHEWALIEKKGKTTFDILYEIANYSGVSQRDVGYAGLKDKHARTVQWFSSLGPMPSSGQGFKALVTKKSGKKLRPGNLIGNWFRIELETPDNDEVIKTLKELSTKGVPNFFGPQRFSTRNQEIGQLLIKGEKNAAIRIMKSQRTPLSRRFFRLMEDAYLSFLFNQLLSERIQSPEPIEGDIISRYGPTAPMFGSKVPLATGLQGELETGILKKEGLSLKDFPGKGKRRALFIPLFGLEYNVSDNLNVRFFLPKGSYATAVMREIGKPTSSSSS